jgi:hypothetical protein
MRGRVRMAVWGCDLRSRLGRGTARQEGGRNEGEGAEREQPPEASAERLLDDRRGGATAGDGPGGTRQAKLENHGRDGDADRSAEALHDVEEGSRPGDLLLVDGTALSPTERVASYRVNGLQYP